MTGRPIRALITDDEPSARDSVRALLARTPDVETVGECADGPETLRSLIELRPDHLFLDVQLPGWNGVETLERIPDDQMPVVVFVTAFEDYALPAFDHHAADYLLKPYSDSRFNLALARVRERLEQRSAGELRRSLVALAERAMAVSRGRAEGFTRPEYLKCVPVGTATGVVMVPTSEIRWVEAAGDYARLHTGTRTFLVRSTMAALEERLDPAGFVRIHRSTIISLDRLQEIRGAPSSDHVVVLKDGTSLPISDRGREHLSRALGIRL
jgi:two-component system LytT family response regulator